MQQEGSRSSVHSEDLFKLIVESVRKIAIFATDLEGNLVSWNPGVEKLLGYTEEEWVGRHCSIIFTPEDVAQGTDQRELETAAREGQAEDKRWHVRHNSTRFWANGLMMPLHDAGGELYGFAKVMRDESEWKRAEQERERFLSVGTDLLVITSLDGHFKWVSPAWERTFGWTMEELTARPWLHFIHPDDHERTIQEAERLFIIMLPKIETSR